VATERHAVERGNDRRTIGGLLIRCQAVNVLITERFGWTLVWQSDRRTLDVLHACLTFVGPADYSRMTGAAGFAGSTTNGR